MNNASTIATITAHAKTLRTMLAEGHHNEYVVVNAANVPVKFTQDDAHCTTLQDCTVFDSEAAARRAASQVFSANGMMCMMRNYRTVIAHYIGDAEEALLILTSAQPQLH